MSHPHQQGIAHIMTTLVIDLLETIKVHEQHGKLTAIGLGTLQGLLQLLIETQAVGQAG